MGNEKIVARMPEGVRQVEFNESARVPSGLTRLLSAGEGRVIFLEKGCVVVRELVEEGGRKVVKSTALPLSGGLVRTIILEEEVLGAGGTDLEALRSKQVAEVIAETTMTEARPDASHYRDPVGASIVEAAAKAGAPLATKTASNTEFIGLDAAALDSSPLPDHPVHSSELELRSPTPTSDVPPAQEERAPSTPEEAVLNKPRGRRR